MRAANLLRTCAFAALAAGLPACAAHDVHEAPAAPSHGAPPPPTPTTPDAPPPHLEPLPGEALADDAEANFAEFERLLADKETRLRAAGITLARREEAKPFDSRFAPPPPDSREEALGDAAVRPETKAKKTARKPAARAQAGATAPTSTPVAGKTPAPAAEKRPAAGRKDADAAATSELEQQGGRCQTICDLAASTCELEGRICDLAVRHPNEPRYADLCRRAEDDCRVASEACQLCSP